MKRNLVFFPILFALVMLGCCVNIDGESLKNNPAYTKYIGCEYELTEELFLAKSFGNLYVVEPFPEDNVLRKFTNSPTLESFKNKTWNKEEYSGEYEYLEVIPKGAQLKLVDIVRMKNIEVGITYHVYANFINYTYKNQTEVNITWIVNDKEKPEKLRGAVLIKCENN